MQSNSFLLRNKEKLFFMTDETLSSIIKSLYPDIETFIFKYFNTIEMINNDTEASYAYFFTYY